MQLKQEQKQLKTQLEQMEAKQESLNVSLDLISKESSQKEEKVQALEKQRKALAIDLV